MLSEVRERGDQRESGVDEALYRGGSFWDGQGVEIETRYHLEGVECGGFGFRYIEPTAMSLMVSKELLGRSGARA